MAQFDTAKFDTGLIVGIRQAARQLRGASRRNWFAWACTTYAGGSPRAAETIFGWNRKAVARGLSKSQAVTAETALDVEKNSASSAGRRQGLLQGCDINQASFSKAKPVAQASGWHRKVVGYHRAATIKLHALISRTFDS